ncbi:MAG: hypothetical protein ACXVBY_10750 [Isosphaeraceae bacterium]
MRIVIALIDLVVVIVLIIRRVDVRLVLLAAAVPLVAVSGGLKVMLTKLVEEMANPGTVVPICTALGFAYVLRITECGQHLIRLLLRPLRHVRWLLIPGGISAGYLVNTTIVSQTGTAAVLGPILIPLAAGRRRTAGHRGSDLAAGFVDGRRVVQSRRRRDAKTRRVDRPLRSRGRRPLDRAEPPGLRDGLALVLGPVAIPRRA